MLAGLLHVSGNLSAYNGKYAERFWNNSSDAADFSGGGDLFQIDGFTVVAVNIGNHIALDQKIWIL